ncbi:hypothetical protein [Variovorax paradoxus]|uniref:hypothetical protein n=1 Tax=Variovorax paradoxus TaxID=34073 RepID=UPI001ABC4D79
MRDLFEEAGIAPRDAPAPAAGPRDLFAEAGLDVQPVKRKSLPRLAETAAIPLVGPALAALGVEVDARGIGKGLLSGLADIGNTVINSGTKAGADAFAGVDDRLGLLPARVKRPRAGITNLVTGQAPMSQAERDNADRAAALEDFNRENASPWFTGGRLAGNVIGTYPVGGAISAPLRAAAPALGPLADALATGGFRTGLAPTSLAGRAGNVALRAVGGAGTGGASAGLVNPGDAGLGALVGAVLPPGLQALGLGTSALGVGVRRMLTPQIAKDASSVLNAGGYSAADLPMVRAALMQPGPRIVPEQPTVSQILMNPEISQLERSVRNAPGGGPALLARDQAQNEARLGVLDSIAPVAGDLPAARTNFGNTIAPRAQAARAEATKQVNQAFNAVDPMDDTRFFLPIAEMEAAQAKFLGDGTFGTGSKAQAAVDTARRVGTEELPAVTAARMPGVNRQGQTIVDAIKALGGLRVDSRGAQELGGEIRDLRKAGNGVGAIFRRGNGQSPDTLAEAMHAQGFLPDADASTLFNVLREHASGNKRFAMGADRGNTFQAGLEASMGDAPGAEVIPKAVPFQTVQNLRSSVGEAAEQARAKGANKEAAALDNMKADIDARVDAVARGEGQAGEFFPPDIVAQWRKAIDMHAEKQNRFARGPQAGMFRKGGDGNYSVEGGELAPKFFSPRGSQSEDIEALHRMGLGDDVRDSLKSYATTDASRKTTAGGTLSAAQYNKWLDSHAGAIRGLFNEGEQARLAGVGQDVQRAADALGLGRATGSNTSQNVQNALGLGLLDSRAVNMLASRTPVVGRFTGPILDALKESAKRGKAGRIGGLLSDPDALAEAIAELERTRVRATPLLPAADALSPLFYRAAPVLVSGR